MQEFFWQEFKTNPKMVFSPRANHRTWATLSFFSLIMAIILQM
jgi:hypothetical protein